MIEIIVNVLSTLINIVLIPIDTFIASTLPQLATVLSYVTGFLSYILTFIVWAISWLPYDSIVINFCFDIMIFYFLWTKFAYPISMFINWLKEFRS